MLDLIRRDLTQLGGLVAKPWAFALVLTYGILWFLFAPDTFGWQGLATMAVWFMTLLSSAQNIGTLKPCMRNSTSSRTP